MLSNVEPNYISFNKLSNLGMQVWYLQLGYLTCIHYFHQNLQISDTCNGHLKK